MNTPVWGGLGTFWVGDTDGDTGPVVVVGVALDVVVVVVDVAGLLLALLPHAVNTPAAMIATAPAAAATRPAVVPDLIPVRPIVRDCCSRFVLVEAEREVVLPSVFFVIPRRRQVARRNHVSNHTGDGA